jgi:hypothetical protein
MQRSCNMVTQQLPSTHSMRNSRKGSWRRVCRLVLRTTPGSSSSPVESSGSSPTLPPSTHFLNASCSFSINPLCRSTVANVSCASCLVRRRTAHSLHPMLQQYKHTCM